MENSTPPDGTLDSNAATLARASVPDPGEDAHHDRGESESTHTPGHWRYELRRWLATLNPGRTGHEYKKAITYFFDTPGVPQEVAALNFDLLLAYRGALALRAADPARGVPSPPADAVALPYAALAPHHAPLIESGSEPDEQPTPSRPHGDDDDDPHETKMTPLAPATVNIRLTALRQFLVHCIQVGSLPQLTSDAVRAALRRLRIERRRPYQVLSEPEWGEFLAAVLEPVHALGTAHQTGTGQPGEHAPGGRRSPWGMPRAARTEAATPAPTQPSTAGQATAQRDHALLSLALATGLRAIELSLLDTGDLIREWHTGEAEWWLVLPDSKTKGQHGGRTLPLAAPLVQLLQAYLSATGRRWDTLADRATPLFLSRRRSGPGRLSTVQIRRIVDRVERRWAASRGDSDGGAGGEGRAISPHALRHSTAIALLEGNATAGRPPASVEHVRGWLGHFDIRTTQGYLAHLDARRHRRPFTISPAAPLDSSSTTAAPTSHDALDTPTAPLSSQDDSMA